MVELQEKLQNHLGKLDAKNSSKLSPADIQLIIKSLYEMSQTLQKVSLNEISSNQIVRENGTHTLDIAQLKLSNEKLKEYHQKSITENHQLIQKIKMLEYDIQTLNQQIISNRKQNDELAKKLQRSEKRVQLILETNISAQKDSLKSSLQDLLGENEQLKKNALTYQKDISKLQNQNSQLNWKIQRLTRKLSSMHITKDSSEEDYYDSEKMNITLTEIPRNFNFRYALLSQEFKAFMTNVGEQTADEFIQQLQTTDNPDFRKQQLFWLYNQLVNQKEFNEKHNYFLIRMHEIMKITQIQELSQFVRNLQTFFHVQEINLWIRDHSTGVLQTETASGKIKKVICAKGLFKECLDNKCAQNKLSIQKYVLYQSIDQEGQDVLQNRTYVIPLLTNTMKPAGLIEVSIYLLSETFNNYNSDLQYFASILASYVTEVLNKIEEETELKQLVMYREIYMEEFLKLCKCQNKKLFVMKMKEMQKRIMLLSQCEFIFIESELVQDQKNEQSKLLNRKFVEEKKKYSMWLYQQDDGEMKYFNGLQGITGQIVQNKKAGFYQNITKDINFHNQIDINSILPVYMYPVLVDESKQTQNSMYPEINEQSIEVIAVIQISLTKKQLKRHKFKDSEMSLQESDNEARLFCEFVAAAYRVIHRFLK